MEVEFAFLAEKVAQDPTTKMVVAGGIGLNQISVRKFPGMTAQLGVMVGIRATPQEVGADGTIGFEFWHEQAGPTPIKVELDFTVRPNPINPAHSTIHTVGQLFPGLEVPRAGEYEFRIKLNGTVVKIILVSVYQASVRPSF